MLKIKNNDNVEWKTLLGTIGDLQSNVSGLLMPFTGEESKSLEFLVDCYNQSAKNPIRSNSSNLKKCNVK